MSELNGSPEKNSINFTLANTDILLEFILNANDSYLFDNGKEIVTFNGKNKNVNFPTWFCLGSISDEFSATESR